jgi:hypothetical protein
VKICYCCPTRGKPEFVADFVMETVNNATLLDTMFVIAIDEDEEDKYAHLFPKDRLMKSVAPREDSLGAKFNRCAKAYDADLYIMGVDDRAIQESGWDGKLNIVAELFQDGIGMVTFGKQWNENLPAFQAVTKKFIELNGFFMAPYFPFWWHDTWNLEVGELSGRMLHFHVPVRYPERAEKWSRRDLAYWAKFFDDTRGLRIEAAERILTASDSPPWHRFEVMQRRPLAVQYAEQRNALLRDPVQAARFEGGHANDQHVERHARLKASANSMLARSRL